MYETAVTNSAVEIQSAPIFSSVETELTSRASSFEPFVDENVVARFLQITPRRVLEMARKGHTRKTWRFRMSEIDAHFSRRPEKRASATNRCGSSRNPGREKNW